MKIVHINFTLETGGIETMLVDILNEQCSLAELHLVLINDKYNINLLNRIDSRVKVWHINRPSGSRNPLYIARLNRLLFQQQPAIVHCHNHQIAKLLWQHIGQRYLTIHDVLVPTNYFRKYDKLFAISNVVKQDILQRSGLAAERIYNGIQTADISHKTTYTSGKFFHIVQISRLQHAKKGQHILLEALHKLIYRDKLIHLRVEFVGEGESLAYLQQLTRDWQLTEYVVFSGLKTRASLYCALKNYHLLVQPSLYEGFGLTVAEGMAAGVPVLVSNIDGPMELIDNEQFGYSFPVGNAGELAEEIRKLVLNYESPSVQIKADDARKHVRASFDVRQTAKQYLASY